jgi:uncharacterized protein (TIGR03083 family)
MFDAERVRASWQRESAAIDTLIDQLDERAATMPIREDGWTAQDLVGHVANAARGFLHAIQGNLSESFDIDALNEQRRQHGRQRSWSDTVRYWQRVRDEVAAFLADSHDGIGDEPATLTWLPQITTKGDALRAMIVHTRSHRQELEQGATSGRQTTDHGRQTTEEKV